MSQIEQIFANNRHVFITGTDTEVGKTFCSALLLNYLNSIGKSVMPFKPIAAGCEKMVGFDEPVNEDAVALWNATQRQYSLHAINPIRFEPPIAPHIAAGLVGKRLTANDIDSFYLPLHEQPLLIEGAGGWYLPLNEQELLSDWVAQHNIPVIMVVGVKLGCLNHALLTANAIAQSGAQLVGWIANFIEGRNAVLEANVEYLQNRLAAPMLCEVEHGASRIKD